MNFFFCLFLLWYFLKYLLSLKQIIPLFCEITKQVPRHMVRNSSNIASEFSPLLTLPRLGCFSDAWGSGSEAPGPSFHSLPDPHATSQGVRVPQRPFRFVSLCHMPCRKTTYGSVCQGPKARARHRRFASVMTGNINNNW